MVLAKVIGTVTCSVKHDQYAGKKLMIVQPVDNKGEVSGTCFLAVDSVQAGTGDLVVVFDEGGSARDMLEEQSCVTIRTVIGGIVDEVSDEEYGEEHAGKTRGAGL